MLAASLGCSKEAKMSQRLAFWIFLAIVTAGCSQNSSPTSATSPSPPCTVTLSVRATIDGYPNGGSFPVSVTTVPASGCGWTATSQASWIHVPDGAAGTGSGTFTFTADANPGPVRAGTLTVGGNVVAFNQTSAGSSCVYQLSVGSTVDGYPSGLTYRVGVTTRPSNRCAWTAVSNAAWIHVTSGNSGSGSGSFTFVEDANTGPARVGTLAAAGWMIVFHQSSQ
jgi:hypothetical protein